MNGGEVQKLENIDPDDINDLLESLQDSFGVEFAHFELKSIKTFGELCDIIELKIEEQHEESCTSQQAFYKLRSILATNLKLGKDDINLETNLREIFPLKNRREMVWELESGLGFELNLLRPKAIIRAINITLSLGLYLLVFVNSPGKLLVFFYTVIGLHIIYWFGKELRLNTVKELVKEMEISNYRRSRRNPSNVNKKEVLMGFKKLFSDHFNLHPSVLTRDAKLFS